MVLPGLWLDGVMPDGGMGCAGAGRARPGRGSHPQYHLKLLLERMGVDRGEVRLWRSPGEERVAGGPRPARSPMRWPRPTSHKWKVLRPAERRLTGIRLAELPDPAAEAQAIALALREALETPGRTRR